MNRKVILIVALAALVLAAILTNGFGLWGDDDADGELTLYGNVDIREVEMAFRVPGRIEAIPVEEGDRVEEGDLLAELDPQPVEDRVAEAEARIAEAGANLAALANGSRPQDIAQARARLAAAEAQLDNARGDYERRDGLVEEGAISRNVWDRTVSALRSAEAQVAEASAALSRVREGARSEDVEAARARLQAAEAARASASTDLEDTRLRAASEGTVLTRAAEPGSLVQPGETVITLALDRPVRVRAYIGEPDLSRISPGMAVEVHVDGNPKVYAGTIGYISPQAEFTPKSVETESLRTDLVYRLRIVVEDPDDGLRQGQPVTVIVPEPRSLPAD